MKLYYAQGACSFSPHIVLHELGLAHEAVKVDLVTGEAADGVHIREINPKGYVPALVLNAGEVLTEGAAIVQYLASLKPEMELMPTGSPIEQARAQEWLNYIAMELHKNLSVLFDPALAEEKRTALVSRLMKRFALVEKTLEKRPYLIGERFTVADAYLYTVSTWTRLLQVDISGLKSLQAYMAKLDRRPSVIAAREVESVCTS